MGEKLAQEGKKERRGTRTHTHTHPHVVHSAGDGTHSAFLSTQSQSTHISDGGASPSGVRDDVDADVEGMVAWSCWRPAVLIFPPREFMASAPPCVCTLTPSLPSITPNPTTPHDAIRRVDSDVVMATPDETARAAPTCSARSNLLSER